MDAIIAGQKTTVADILADLEPTAAELAAIEREESVIEAEVELLDFEIQVLARGGLLDEVAQRRYRRLQRQLLAAQRTAEIDAYARRSAPSTEVTA